MMIPVRLFLGVVVLLGFCTMASGSDREPPLILDSQHYKVLGPNTTWDVPVIFVPGKSHRVECTCDCVWTIYDHMGSYQTIPAGRFIRLRVWNRCWDQNLVMITNKESPQEIHVPGETYENDQTPGGQSYESYKAMVWIMVFLLASYWANTGPVDFVMYWVGFVRDIRNL